MSDDDMDLLLPPDFDRDKLKWATVTVVTPLTIRLDGEAGALLGIPGTLVAPLAVGNRVLVALIINDDPRRKYRRAIIMGVAGGVPNLETRLAAAEAKIAAMEAAWLTTHTPTLTNLTVGAGGVLTFRHRLIGKTLDWKFKFKYGTGSAVGTDPTFTLPYTPHSSYAAGEDAMGQGQLFDVGNANRACVARLTSGATLLLVAFGSTGNHASIAAGAPWTWGTGDTMMCDGKNEIA